MQTWNPKVLDDVYSRYRLSFSDIPKNTVPSAHSIELELVCAKESFIAYAVYPDGQDEATDEIPAANRGLFAARRIQVAELLDAETGDWESQEGYREIKSDRAAALVLWKDEHVIVAFRGTANWQDWIHDGTVKTLPPPIGEAGEFGALQLHMGFYGLMENIFPAIWQAIANRAEAIKSRLSLRSPLVVTLCGHSLGGALALCFGPKLREQLRDVSQSTPMVLGATYTFGAPRIGKGEVWRFIQRPHYRLIASGDPVPLSPVGFSEDYQATYLDKASLPSKPESPFRKITRAIGATVTSRLNPKRHDIEVYVELIAAKLVAMKPIAVEPTTTQNATVSDPKPQSPQTDRDEVYEALTKNKPPKINWRKKTP